MIEMINKIKPLPTEYRGVKYRSRTEARWAVFLDECQVSFTYEPEGFDLGGEWYLPDFWIPSANVWLEVKGIKPNIREEKLACRLSLATGCPVLIAIGAPSTNEEFNILAYHHGRYIIDVGFTGCGCNNVFITSHCQNFSIVIRGSIGEYGGVPYPIVDQARIAANKRFGVHE